MVRMWSSGSLSCLSLSSLSQMVGGLHGACLLKLSPNAKSLSSIIGGRSLFNLCLMTSNDRKLIASQSSSFYLSHLFIPLRYLHKSPKFSLVTDYQSRRDFQ